MSDIFQEVDEDLRRDTASALWAKYQNLVYGVVALIILGTAGVTGWQIYDRQAREKAGNAYLAALQAAEQDPKSANDVLGQLVHAGGPFSDLARFDLAHAALKAGNKQEALDLLTAMAGDAGFAAPLKGAAGLMGGYVALDLGKADAAIALAQPLIAEGQPTACRRWKSPALLPMRPATRRKPRKSSRASTIPSRRKLPPAPIPRRPTFATVSPSCSTASPIDRRDGTMRSRIEPR